jgi:kynurenine formamidase
MTHIPLCEYLNPVIQDVGMTADTATSRVDPITGLEFFELSHPWGHGAPTYPGFEDVQIFRSVNHARDGVMSQRIRTVMHTGTHVNAPIHMIPGAAGIGDLPLRVFFGSAVIVSAPKEQWELVTADDLARADIRPGDIVLIATGWHRFYSDSQRYFAHAPGLDRSAAEILIERGAKLVGVDTPFIDHPLATSLAEHRGGPYTKYLPQRYREATGRDPKAAFPEWNPAHRALLGAGIPTIENVGGDVAALLDRRVTVHAMPWRWPGGDACPVRLIGLADRSGTLRLETGHQEAGQ